jgi:hypothetical protein
MPHLPRLPGAPQPLASGSQLQKLPLHLLFLPICQLFHIGVQVLGPDIGNEFMSQNCEPGLLQHLSPLYQGGLTGVKIDLMGRDPLKLTVKPMVDCFIQVP